MKRFVILVSAVTATFIVPYGIAKVMSEWAMGWIDGAIKLSVVGSNFLSAFSHRAFQFMVAVLLLRLIFKWEAVKRLFRLDDLHKGIRAFKGVIIFWPILTILFFAGSVIFVDGFGDYLSTLYPQSSSWLLAQVSRDFLLFDALPEEVFYRGFMMVFLSLGFKSVVEFGRFKTSHAALLSVPLFALAHVQVSFFPFAIIQYDSVQLVLTMFTGLLFAYAYEKTECLVVPILLHGYTNLVITVSAYVVLTFV